METLICLKCVICGNVTRVSTVDLSEDTQSWKLQQQRQPSLWVLANEAAFKVVCPTCTCGDFCFKWKIEKCTRCHGKGKSVEPSEKLFTYLQVLLGTEMWQIINKLFIWRETCFFDGSELKKHAAIPYCVSKELSLEKCSFQRRKKGRRFAVSLAPMKRDRCVVWGSLFAYRLVLISSVAHLKLHTSHDPLLYPRLMACEHLIRIRIEEPPLPPRLLPESTCRGAWLCTSGVKGWSKLLHMPVSTLLLGDVGDIILKFPSIPTGRICHYYICPVMIWFDLMIVSGKRIGTNLR